MTREERQKAIDALKISAPVRAVTQEEFNDYIQTLNQVMDWLEQEPCEDAISRQAVLALAKEECDTAIIPYRRFVKGVNSLPPVTPKYTDEEIQKMQEMEQAEIQKAYELGKAEQPNRWIPVSEKLPNNTDPVNITWINHVPESYYADIKDKTFTATGHYCNGRWYWYSSTCQDYLEEYGRCDVDEIDKDIEVVAWMPLPEPYKIESEEVDG